MRADQLPGMAELWTGSDWATASVAQSAHRHAVYRVELNGGHVVCCGKDQLWAVREGNNFAVRASVALRPGDEVFPFINPRRRARVAPGEASSGAYAALGRAVGQSKSSNRSLAASITGLHGRPEADLYAFVSAWALAQCGHLIAPTAGLAATLHLLLIEAGVKQSTVIGREAFIPKDFAHALGLSTESACVVPGNNFRNSRVVGVTNTGTRSAMYRIEFVAPLGGGYPQSIVAGIALLVAPNAARGGEESDADSHTSSD